jgi:hypothetical protein
VRTFFETASMTECLSFQRRSDPRRLPDVSFLSCGAIASLALMMLIPPIAQPQTPCLDGRGRAQQFDIDRDRNSEGDSFSCDVFVRASVALGVLEDFRYGFLYDSRTHLARSIHFPLKVTIATSATEDRVLFLRDVTQWLAFKATNFDRYERALIACANLSNVHIFRKWSGFAIGQGRVWFFNTRDYGLKVGQINVAPMNESLFRDSCVGSDGPR